MQSEHYYYYYYYYFYYYYTLQLIQFRLAQITPILLVVICYKGACQFRPKGTLWLHVEGEGLDGLSWVLIPTAG
jgi:hypothetical protein